MARITRDEVTPLVAGGNAGWDPKNRAGLTCPDNYCGYAGNPTTMPMTDTARFPTAMRASWVHDSGARGMGPATFLSGTQWKGWDGRLLVGVMAGERIAVLQLDSGRNDDAGRRTRALPSARSRSLVQGLDGNLYVVTDGGEIWRVVPALTNGYLSRFLLQVIRRRFLSVVGYGKPFVEVCDAQ